MAVRKYREMYSSKQYHSGGFDFPVEKFDAEVAPFSMFDGVSIWVSRTDRGEGGEFLSVADQLHGDQDGREHADEEGDRE